MGGREATCQGRDDRAELGGHNLPEESSWGITRKDGWKQHN